MIKLKTNKTFTKGLKTKIKNKKIETKVEIPITKRVKLKIPLVSRFIYFLF
jgi:mRNA-degrading endonuclease YafQ of YafQ-DinJ toxin-antitoxin module